LARIRLAGKLEVIVKYYIRGKGSVKLTRNDFIFKGGEGIVYGKGNVAYKIFDDPARLIPEAKIRELAMLQRREIINPLDAVLDKNNARVGFSMRLVKDAIPLAKLFTASFKKRNGITNTIILELVEAMKEVIRYIHETGCLMVDGNEFNYLVDKSSFKYPYFIDVNSYQTPAFPATAIMPSIRDWHSNSFSEFTDWFSFAIITFQLFVGLHPYKGRHPAYSRKAMGTSLLYNRMKDNVSVFNKDVSIPPSAGSLDSIPENYRNWFNNLFERGERTPPPTTAGSVLTATSGKRIVKGTDRLEIKMLREFNSEILAYKVVCGKEIIRTESHLYIDGRTFEMDPGEKLILSPRTLTPVLAKVAQNEASCRVLPAVVTPAKFPKIECSEIMEIDNTLYFNCRDKLVEMQISEKNDRIIAAVKSLWNILPKSNQVLDGLICQNALGAPYLVIPQPRPNGPSSCVNIHIPEIADFRILNARHENRICMIVGHKDDRYSRIILKFDDSYKSYDIRIIEDIEYTGINFTVLDNGVVIAINDEGSLEIFSNRYGMDRIDILKDSNIESTMQLCKDGIAAKFYKRNQLFSIRMK